ncbi:MAG: baseplate J/gp47 family protein [Acetobacteraceae bacterium]
MAQTETLLLGDLPQVSPIVRRLILRAIARTQAGLVWSEHGYLAWLAEQLMPDMAESDYLARWATIFAVPKKPAAAATGAAVFSGGSGDLPIPSALPLLAPDGVTQLATTSSGVIPTGGGSITLPIAAPQPGAAANLATGAILTLGQAIAGVSPTAIVADPGTTGGADDESDDAWRARVLLRVRTPPQGGASVDYLAWALAQPGVTRAWVFPLNRGAGTVDVAFVMDGRPNIIPQPADVVAVQSAIDRLRPVTANVVVFAPAGDPFAVTVAGLSPSTVTTQAAVNAAVADLLARDGMPAGRIYLNRLFAAISDAGGVDHFALTTPTADVVSATGHMPIFAPVIFT